MTSDEGRKPEGAPLWSSLWSNRRIRLAFGRARRLIGGHRQRDGNPAEAALDFALDVKRKLASAELGEMNAIPSAQSASLCPPLPLWQPMTSKNLYFSYWAS